MRESRLPSKAFGFGSCSDKFKIRVQRRYVKKWKPVVDAWERGEEIQSLVFYDAGEPHRAQNQKKEKGIVKILPLIEAGINRDGCKQIIDDAGFCQPGKSSCWFCPSMKKNEIKKLEAGHPDLMERALEIERRGVETLTELNNGVAPSGSSVMVSSCDERKHAIDEINCLNRDENCHLRDCSKCLQKVIGDPTREVQSARTFGSNAIFEETRDL